MGLFGWLFNQEERTTRNSAACSEPDQDKRFIDLPSRRFFGPFRSSANRRYKMAWNEGHLADAGTQRRKTGRYLLLDGEKVVAEGRITRPTDGAVANNGTFVVIDAKQATDLSGALHAFDIHGKQIILRNFRANIFNCGISDDGRFAVCQTCNSSDENDSGIIAIFDLVAASELSTWMAESGWPSQYTFSPDGRTISLGYQDSGRFVIRYPATLSIGKNGKIRA